MWDEARTGKWRRRLARGGCRRGKAATMRERERERERAGVENLR